jgi:IPT/TIG domain
MSGSIRLRSVVAVLALLSVAVPAAAGAASTLKPTISSFTPSAGKAMTKITVLGTEFVHVKSVQVDGMTAAFKLDSSKKLTVTVPAKAKTGKITVVTSAGKATSKHALKIKV